MKGQRDEGVVAGRARLRFAERNQMIDAVFERFDVPVQHRGVARDALTVELLVNLEPVRGRNLVRTDFRPRLFSEDLRRAAVDVVEASLFEHPDNLRKR